MKLRKNKLFLLSSLTLGVSIILSARATSQTLTNLHSFTALSAPVGGVNPDGANPYSALTLSGNTLYGTAVFGGSNGSGSVFAVNIDGSGFTNLYSFTATTGSFPNPEINNDGANPYAGLVLAGDTLYGVTQIGGTNGNGAIFAIQTNGAAFTNLHQFAAGSINRNGQVANTDGAAPQAALILSGNMLYGTAAAGGKFGNGAIFALNTNGSGFTNLYSFSANLNFGPNKDGASPIASLALSGGTLYGAAEYGGTNANGTLFAIQTNGSGFTNIYNFSETAAPDYVNPDGANPFAPLTISGDILYGTTGGGGQSANGTIFAIATNGIAFTNLHNFSQPSLAPDGAYTNTDGAQPHAGLLLSGATLYGTTFDGGLSGNGGVFALNTNGMDFTNFYNFTATSQISPSTNGDGANPQDGLIIANNTLYGTAENGGASGYGSIFALTLAPVATATTPQLSILRSGTNVILTWPTNFTQFTLQTTTNLSLSQSWTNATPPAVIVNAQNTVTNLITGKIQYYRLTGSE